MQVPAQRNLTTKWEALCGEGVACKHAVDPDVAGNVLAAELTEASKGLYELLQRGKYRDASGNLRPIRNDMSKLERCDLLTDTQKNLVKNLKFLSKKFPGTQQVRLLMGHALFGAQITYGLPLFWTISPSARHSGLCIRLSRFLRADPFITETKAKGHAFKPWIGEDAPGLLQRKNEDDCIIDLPDYDDRLAIATSDPAAVMEAFRVKIRFILPRIFGYRMCPICPRCAETDTPCSNKFGNNFEPWGGIAGLCAANGCAVEYQRSNNPHAHGNAHFINAYQFLLERKVYMRFTGKQVLNRKMENPQQLRILA